MPTNWDVHFLYELNSLVPKDPLGARMFTFMGDNHLFRGFPIFFPLIVLWFSNESKERRSRILVGLFATCVATVSSLWSQNHLTVHTRPFLDPALHLQGIDPKFTQGWDHLGSFPSDTGTLFFAFATVIFLESRIAGSIALFWSLLTVGIARSALGWHYPSDMVGSLVLGPGCVFLFTRIQFLGTVSARIIQLCQTRMYVLHAFLFIFLADAYSLFLGLRGFLNGFVIVSKHLLRR